MDDLLIFSVSMQFISRFVVLIYWITRRRVLCEDRVHVSMYFLEFLESYDRLSEIRTGRKRDCLLLIILGAK